ncbi:MAG: efflux RND transporter periplasmic adaptor subunit [Sedimentisphaerales bacterium]|nr:efflux RND transporter periplasmic adaptor subunit [Sedimentisphaerales bacterium]
MDNRIPIIGTNRLNKGWIRRNIIKIVIILAAIAMLTVAMKLPKRERIAPQSEAAPVNVTIATVNAQPQIADSFDLPAAIEPNRIVTVSAEIEGRIEHIPCKEGEPVKSGDLLVQINADLIRPLFEVAQEQVKRDQIEFERMDSLVKDNATSQRDLDDARTKLAISKANLDEVAARLERTRIISPITGTLNDILVEEGEYVNVGASVAQIVDNDTVKVVVDVPERDISFFSVGQQAQIIVNVKGRDITMTGDISFISELANVQTRSTRIEISLDNKERLLRSGRIVLVRLTRRVLNDAIMIPLLAVIPMEGSKAVYVVNSDEAQRRQVELGFIKGDSVQIKSGLKSGDRLIIAGHRFVAPGQKVNIASEKK